MASDVEDEVDRILGKRKPDAGAPRREARPPEPAPDEEPIPEGAVFEDVDDLPEGAVFADEDEGPEPEPEPEPEPQAAEAPVEEAGEEAGEETEAEPDDGKPRIALSVEREAARHGSVTHDMENPEEPAPTEAPVEAESGAGVDKKTLKKLRKQAKKEGLLHSSQLDERLRRGDAEARPVDRQLKVVFDLLNVISLLVLVAVTAGAAGFLEPLGTPEAATYVLAVVAALLAGNSLLFNQIRWRALRGHQGIHVLEKWKADLQLTAVSIIALFTVAFIAVIEVAALLVFVGAVGVGTATAAFAHNFVLFQVIILLVYAMTLVVRENNVTSYQPHRNSVILSQVLTPVAGVAALVGVLLTAGLPQRIGVLTSLTTTQGIYVLTLGVGLEFIAVRIRLRLPSVVSLFRAAVDMSKRANEEMRIQLKKRAQRTYVVAFSFVAVSMAFAGAIATGNIGLGGGNTTIALVIFYVGTALILLGLVAVRIFQGRNLERRSIHDETDLERMVGQKRRKPEEIFRFAVYGVAGFIALIFATVGLLVALEQVAAVPKKYSTDLFILAILFAAGPYGYYFNSERKRIAAIDEKFPDFLRDIAESARAGMTLPRALVTAARGNYGALTEDIRQMAAQVEWGVEFGDSLERFAKRANTPLIDRTVSLVVEAQRAGGNVVDILTAASDDAREIKQIISERDEQMQMYSVVVFIAYFVFIAVVLILSAQFIPAFKEAVGAASGQKVGGLNFKDFDPEDFNTLFFHAALVQAIGGGLVGGVLTKGHPVAGFNNIMIMMVAAWLSFRVLIGVI